MTCTKVWKVTLLDFLVETKHPALSAFLSPGKSDGGEVVSAGADDNSLSNATETVTGMFKGAGLHFPDFQLFLPI